MACHPLVSAFSIDFSADSLPNDALSDLFQAAEDRAPALVILEDLDRIFGADGHANRTAITLPHLLACLDGLAMQNGIVIVATANDPSTLDPAILKRPGRFDRLALFPAPSLEVRRDYLAGLTGWAGDDPAVVGAAREADRLSFAQIREAYILAGQRSFRRRGAVVGEELLAAIRALRSEAHAVSLRADGRSLGFGTASLPTAPTGVIEDNDRRREGYPR
jgi:cell division protease FtsH